MSSLTKPSKFKNISARISKKENRLRNIDSNRLLQTSGSLLSSSCSFVAFTNGIRNGTVGVVGIDSINQSTEFSVLCCHSDFVTDLQFCPYDQSTLATGSYDCSVKIWKIPSNDGSITLPDSPSVHLNCFSGRVERVLWHPLASGLVTCASQKEISIVDIETQQSAIQLTDFVDVVQSISWKADGSLLVSSSKDMKLRVHDPRAPSDVQEAAGHASSKDSRVLWCGETDYFLSSGFDRSLQRDIMLWDARNLSKSVKKESFGTSSGVLVPYYDCDTGICFLAAKGDASISCFEISAASPFLIQNSTQPLEEQLKGCCLAPKRVMDVTQCEVNRLFVLTQGSVTPISYCVPRKATNEFHADLYPDTYAGDAALTGQEWLEGGSKPVPKCSINGQEKRPVEKQTSRSEPTAAAQTTATTKDVARSNSQNGATTEEPKNGTAPNGMASPERPVATYRLAVQHSKFRHLLYTAYSRDRMITNVHNLGKTLPGQCDIFHVNRKWCAFALTGGAGLICIIESNRGFRLPDGVLPSVQNSCAVADFVWNPFDDNELAVGCDDGVVRIWRVPEGGVKAGCELEPAMLLKNHKDRIVMVRYHPTAASLLVSIAANWEIKLWDLDREEEKVAIQSHTEEILTFNWSLNGKYFATYSKDKLIRTFDPRQSEAPLKEGPGSDGIRGARLTWVLQDRFLLVSGFSKTSNRCLMLYDDQLNLVASEDIDTSPSILIPFYDRDTSIVYLTGKGDRIIFCYEILDEKPHLFALTHQNTGGLHQAVAYFPKCECNVTKIEIARGVRLMQDKIEPFGVTVPRAKAEYFQDDLFPDTVVTWQSALTAEEWFEGGDRSLDTMSLRPADMQLASTAPVVQTKEKKYASYNSREKDDAERKKELMDAMVNRATVFEGETQEHGDNEGVDSDEWGD